jgi:hypothetical protein
VRIDSNVTDVASAGTAVQLLNTSDRVLWIKIKSLAANAGIIYVGDSAVSSTNGYELDPGGGVDGQVELPIPEGGSIKASDIWVDAQTSGNDVTWIALLK